MEERSQRGEHRSMEVGVGVDVCVCVGGGYSNPKGRPRTSPQV